MKERVDKEIELLRARYPNLIFQEEGWWVRIPNYQLPEGWNMTNIELAFQFPKASYPQNPFYGFYVPSGLRFGNGTLKNFTDPAPAQPPFGGPWAFFSGNPKPWQPSIEVANGSNIVSWLHGIGQRLREGLGQEE